MRIAIGVHGRFHAFHLAKALLDVGEDVVVFTNYPRSVAARWGLPPEHVRSFVAHGILTRFLRAVSRRAASRVDAVVHRSFGRWLDQRLATSQWDVVHIWSGVAEEWLQRPRKPGTALLMRGSAHIRVQDRILREEEARLGTSLDRPSPWMIAREEREYRATDRVVVLSAFAESTFLAEGTPPERLCRLPLAAPVETYQPSDATLRARVDRLRGDLPIRALFVGALSAQKGLLDLAETVRLLPLDRFAWRLVGPAVLETAALLRRMPQSVEVLGWRPEIELPDHYAWADIFVFPSLQDGFGVVLAQAAASGLPILASTNCGASEFVREGKTGWIVPIRAPSQLAERLLWFDTHRLEAVAMTSAAYEAASHRPWPAVAGDFLALCRAAPESARAREGSRF